ncbi:MAG: ABC transporter permease [Candidatus Hydrogenedentes bacterium]|nr:ABC transporter permease [Candidatus Hydrogenedentota bacterium]
MAHHLPLIALELSRSGRKKSMYLLRTAPAVVCFVFLMFGIGETMGVDTAGTSAESLGSMLRNVLLLFQLGVALFGAPLFSAGSIARERQENTLNLLLLTDCRAHDLVLAKALAAFIQSEMLVLSCLPLQGIAAFLGGITIQASLYDLAVISGLNLAMTAIGILASTYVRRAADAYIICLGLSMALCAATAALFPSVSPFVDDSQKTWWIGGPLTLTCIAVAAISLRISIAILWRPESSPSQSGSRRHYRPMPIHWTPPLLRLGPLARLFNATARECGAGLLQGPLAVVVVVASVLVGLIPFGVVGLLIMLVVSYDAAIILSSARRKGDLDLLFVTAAKDDALARSIFHTELMRAATFLPALAVNAISTSLFASSLFGESNVPALFEWSNLPWFGAVCLVSIADGIVRLMLVVAIACGTAGDSPALSAVSAALHYVVAVVLLGCLGSASVGLVADSLRYLLLPGSSWSVSALPTLIIAVTVGVARWGASAFAIFILFLTFKDNIVGPWRSEAKSSLSVHES